MQWGFYAVMIVVALLSWGEIISERTTFGLFIIIFGLPLIQAMREWEDRSKNTVNRLQIIHDDLQVMKEKIANLEAHIRGIRAQMSQWQ